MVFNPDSYQPSVAGRFLYPTPVQMTDPATNAVKSFSTTIIFRFLGYYFPGTSILMHEPGFAFIIVPDNYTVGAPLNYMGILTTATAQTQKNYASDNHAFAVELDVHQDPEFNDPNDNHICIDVASLNSTVSNTFVPLIPLYTINSDLFQQVWVDYSQADSRVDVYHAEYRLSKPDTPLGSQVGVDMSILKECMYLGFSSALGGATNNVATEATIFAWSFSNDPDTPAPAIKIGRDAGPSPPPPAPPLAPALPPPPHTLSAPVPAPASPPPPSPPPPSAPPPLLASPFVSPGPSKSPTSPPSPAPVEFSNPPPPGFPSPSEPPSPGFSPSSSPGSSSATAGSGSPVKVVVGVVGGVSVLVVIGTIFIGRWWIFKSKERTTSLEEGMEVSRHHKIEASFPAQTAPSTVPARRKLRIFISHTGGEDGSEKVFPVRLFKELEKNPCYEVIIDRYTLSKGKPFAEEILQKIRPMDVGIIVVTEEYFKHKWPMIELEAFMDRGQKKEGSSSKVRILPLFYKLKPRRIQRLLEERFWENEWAHMSTEKHPIDVGKYRDVVARLCTFSGVEYPYNDLSREAEYINVILE